MIEKMLTDYSIKPIHKNIIEWCLKYGKDIMNNFEDDDGLVYDPIVFNLISRVNMVDKRGWDTRIVETFELDKYLDLAIKKIEESLEKSIILGLQKKLSVESFNQVIYYLYPQYLIALLCPPDVVLTPVLS